jgi:NitT/TauT family transport system permease protein
LWKLRFPASLPFLFASLKVAVAIALTGAIVAELPTGAVAGIGARLLQGSYYGQTLQIWAALFVAAFAAAALVWAVGAVERLVMRHMGGRP